MGWSLFRKDQSGLGAVAVVPWRGITLALPPQRCCKVMEHPRSLVVLAVAIFIVLFARLAWQLIRVDRHLCCDIRRWFLRFGAQTSFEKRANESKTGSRTRMPNPAAVTTATLVFIALALTVASAGTCQADKIHFRAFEVATDLHHPAVAVSRTNDHAPNGRRPQPVELIGFDPVIAFLLLKAPAVLTLILKATRLRLTKRDVPGRGHLSYRRQHSGFRARPPTVQQRRIG